MRILLSTEEGYPKDKTDQNKKKFSEKKIHFHFSGDNAPVKAVRALIQKYGITQEDITGTGEK